MRNALKMIEAIPGADIQAGDYFRVLDHSLSELLRIYEQEGRTGRERIAILKADILNLQQIFYNNINDAVTGRFNNAAFILDIIAGHLRNTAELGILLPDGQFCATALIVAALLNAGLQEYYPKLLELSLHRDLYDSIANHLGIEPLPPTPTARDPLPTPRNTAIERGKMKAAIDAGLMERRGDGYFWKGSRASLCRFLGLVYGAKGTPFKALEALFEYNKEGKPARVTRLDTGIPNSLNSKIEPEIEKLFNNE